MQNEKTIIQVNTNDIIPNRFQPRVTFDNESINELALSIKQHGIINPLLLRKIGTKYELIAGERRLRAAMMIGLPNIPAIIVEIDDNSSAELAMIENIQRKELSPIEEARAYKQLLDLGQITQEQLAMRMGKSQPTIANKIRLLQLDEEVQVALLNNQISERHARSLLSLKNPIDQKTLLNEIIAKKMTVKDTELKIKELLQNKPLINEEIPPLEDDLFSIEQATKIRLNKNNQNQPILKEENMNQNVIPNQPIYQTPPMEPIKMEQNAINQQELTSIVPTEPFAPIQTFQTAEQVPNQTLDYFKDKAAVLPERPIHSENSQQSIYNQSSLQTNNYPQPPSSDMVNIDTLNNNNSITPFPVDYNQSTPSPHNDPLEKTQMIDINQIKAKAQDINQPHETVDLSSLLETPNQANAEEPPPAVSTGRFINSLEDEKANMNLNQVSQKQNFFINQQSPIESTNNFPNYDTLNKLSNQNQLAQPIQQNKIVEPIVNSVESKRTEITTGNNPNTNNQNIASFSTKEELIAPTFPEPIATPVPTNDKINVDEIFPTLNLNSVAEQQKPISKPQNAFKIRNAINMTRSLITNIETAGYQVEAEELDLEDEYQIIIKIQKD